MIGLVVVSHSTKTAKEITEAAAQMGGGSTRIVPAGGDESGIGTSPDRTREGIEEADGDDGVIVFVDFGSTVMNAELAIGAAMNSKAVIADAPVLEETLDAAVGTTSREATLDLVAERAKDTRDYQKLN